MHSPFGMMRRFLWGTAAVAAALSGAVYLNRPVLQSGSLPATEVTGQAQIGGAFELTTQTGKRITDKELFRQVTVVTVGWTLDPDQTPAALQVLSAALVSAPLSGRPLQAVFVTLDPQRDTPDRLAVYLKSTQPLVGLTGSQREINDFAAAYKLYWKRIEDGALPGGYSIDFASLYYVMAPGGNFLGVVPYTTNATELAGEIGKLVPK